jgi:chemotaxis protein methyltransferase CheR
LRTLSDREPSISNADLARLRALIYTQSGISLGADKRTMLELRLRPRLRSLGLASYRDYCEHLFTGRGQRDELVHLLDAVTTNKTDFFREPGHFDFLVRKALPEIEARQYAARERAARPLLVWSAGCSTGEEPYTLAMVLSEYANTHPGFRFRILATDLCTEVLEKAQRAIYSCEAVAPVPAELRRRYLMRGRNRGENVVRIVPELRELVEFHRLNFMDRDYGLTERVDMFFCRNVIIYFDRPTQEQILGRLTEQLVPGGYAFLGHSETLHGLDVPLSPSGPSVYRKSHGGA